MGPQRGAHHRGAGLGHVAFGQRAQSDRGPVTHRSPRDGPSEPNDPLAPRIALRLPTRSIDEQIERVISEHPREYTVVLQLWLLMATMNAWLGRDDSVVWPALVASTACLLLNLGLLRYLREE